MSKTEAFMDIIKEINPTVIAITETWLNDAERFEIDGYHVRRNDRKGKGGGILLAVRNEIKNITTETHRTEEGYESIWIVIDNTKVKLKMGVLYMPQESETPKEAMKEIYKDIRKEIQEGKKNNQKVIMIGDMNCKIGNKIEGNKEEVTTGGKELLKLTEREELEIVNGTDKCKGIWTRDENGSKSILDYVLIDKDEVDMVEGMLIDEDKVVAPFRIKAENNEKRIVFSDHNAISVRLNNIDIEKRRFAEIKNRKNMTKEGYERYQKQIKDENISKIWDGEGCMQEKYTAWKTTVENIKARCETKLKAKRKNISKQGRLARKMRNALKKQRKELVNEDEREELQVKIAQLKDEISTEEKQSKVRKIRKVVEEIRSYGGHLNGGAFQKLKKKLTRRKIDSAHAVLDKTGKRIEEHEEIKDVYLEYYQGLLNRRPPESTKEQERESEVNELFGRIMKVADKQEPMQVTEEEVGPILRKLKKKKAKDADGWVNEMLIYGGDEMVKSVTKMTNLILKDLIVPDQWNRMMIYSIHKKGDMKKLTNKRGLFLTNIVSKAFEKILDFKVEFEYDPGQNGGKKRRGVIDDWIILMATRDKNRLLKQNTYIFFADLVKCFDRLWLRDCLIDTWKAGMREREAKVIYVMNKKAHISVRTPVGITEEAEIIETVKQGTVLAVKLCCTTTGEINTIGKKAVTVISPNAVIGAIIFVDDIMAIGGMEMVREVMRNCVLAEEKKGWEFSTEKTNYMVMLTGKRNEEIEEIDVEVKQGKIERTYQYKYNGNFINEKGNMDTQLDHMNRNIEWVVSQANVFSSWENVGSMEIQVKLFLYETTIEKSIFFNVEAWTNLRQEDEDRLEVIQGKILKRLLGLPKSTPYWGLLIELGLWPVKWRTLYKKAMLLHNLLTSDNDRVAKHVISDQKVAEQPNCFYSEVNDLLMLLNIQKDPSKMKKNEWKKLMKDNITKKVKQEAKNKQQTLTKLRFIGEHDRQNYVTELNSNDVRDALRIRLNMTTYLGGNTGKETTCMLCKEGTETTEHVFECKAIDNIHRLKTEDLRQNDTDKMAKIVKLFKQYGDAKKIVESQ